MKGIVSNKISIYDQTPEMHSWCRDHLIIDNPDYIKKKNMGLWTGNVPRQFCLYEEIGTNCLVLPFGCLHEIHNTFPDMPLESHIHRADGFQYDSHINLYSYQENAVQAILEARNGILVMPCGSGKTQTALETVARIGMRALWITHTQDLLTQSLNRAKSVYGCNPGNFGTITDGRIKIGSGITFATVQTASKVDLTPYRDEFGCVIVDECHKAIGGPTKCMQFYKVLSSLSARYKIGLTATPKRGDGLSRMMFALIGDVIHEVPREAVAATTSPVEVKQIETGYVPDINMALCGDGTINFAGLINDLTHNEKRFDFVLNEINKHKCMLVLGNRVEYLNKLSASYTGISTCLSAMGNSKAARAERKEALRLLNSGELDAVFATYQLAKEGLDVPNLRYVVFTTPEKDEATVIQSAGRVARKSDGKDKGTVIDMVDDFGMLIGWAKKRKNIYVKKLGFKIID